MELDPLDKPFDVIVCGTDIACSVFAAAAARNGLTVLHVEEGDVYGGIDGTVPLHQFASIAKSCSAQGEIPELCSPKRQLPDGWNISTTLLSGNTSSDNVVFIHTDDAPSDLLPTLRKVMIDAWPRLVFCRGASTDLLVESGVSSYMEYKNLDCACLLSLTPRAEGQGQGEGEGYTVQATPVPAGKGEVFSAPTLSLADKRKLMKFLQFVLDVGPEQSSSGTVLGLNEAQLGAGRSLLRPQNKGMPAYDMQEYNDKALSALMKDAEIEGTLQSMLMHAVGLIDCPPGHPREPHAQAGVARLYAHLWSLGRFGRTAYLANMYGTGETSQAFCRACAVHGGVYMLRTRITGWHVGRVGAEEQEGVVGIQVREEGQGETTVYGKRFVVGDRQRHVLPPTWLPPASPPSAYVTVCMALLHGTTGTLPVAGVEGQLWHAILPAWTAPLHFSHAVHVLHTGSSTHVCPPGYSLLYCTSRVSEGGEEAARGVGMKLRDTLLPLLVPAGAAIWRCVYYIPLPAADSSAPVPSPSPPGLHLLSTAAAGETEGSSYITLDGPLQAAAQAWKAIMADKDGTVPPMFPPKPSPVPVPGTAAGGESGGGSDSQGHDGPAATGSDGKEGGTQAAGTEGVDKDTAVPTAPLPPSNGAMDVQDALHLLSQGGLLDDL